MMLNCMANRRVLVVGSAEKSAGGMASAIKLIKNMPVWEQFHCCWIGTQIQKNYVWKIWCALKAYLQALLIIWRYDIIHFHTVPDKVSLLIQLPIFLLALLGKKKIIMHIHMGNQLSRHTQNTLFKWCLRRSDLIIFLARRWQTLFRESYNDIKTPTTILYNACDNIESVPFDSKEKIIIMAAYLNENKAPNLLLRAWKEIKDKYKDWSLYILGNGEIAKYKKISREMGLEDTVHFTGYVVGKEKENYFKKASIYCMCSYEEGFPMVVLEAWAYGINVVTTPVGGLPDVLEDGKNALVFSFGDWEGLARRISYLIDNEDKRRMMSNYSREYVYNHFSLQKVNEMLTNLYTNL